MTIPCPSCGSPLYSHVEGENNWSYTAWKCGSREQGYGDCGLTFHASDECHLAHLERKVKEQAERIAELESKPTASLPLPHHVPDTSGDLPESVGDAVTRLFPKKGRIMYGKVSGT